MILATRSPKGQYVIEHPAVIRVSDAIASAQEILARYAGSLDTSNNAHGLP